MCSALNRTVLTPSTIGSGDPFAGRIHVRFRSKTGGCVKKAQNLCSQKNGKARAFFSTGKKEKGYNKGKFRDFLTDILRLPLCGFTVRSFTSLLAFSCAFCVPRFQPLPEIDLGHRRLIDPRALRAFRRQQEPLVLVCRRLCTRSLWPFKRP